MVQIKKVNGNIKTKKLEPLHRQIQRDSHILEDEYSKKCMDDVYISEHDELEHEFLDEKSSRKILEQSKRQQEELEREGVIPSSSAKYSSEEEDEIASDGEFSPQDLELSAADRDILLKFEDRLESRPTVPLAAAIMQKFNEQLSNRSAKAPAAPAVHPKVVEAFKKVGILLSRYRSGKLPKAFKVIPALKNWEQILAITEPAKWSPQAVYAGTRIFCSNLNSKKAYFFLHSVLLHHFLDQIQREKKISVHVYNALCKSIYKPAAFFKGIVFPLLEIESCTLKAASVMASVISSSKIPMLHSCAALVHITGGDSKQFSGARGIMIRAILDKKYALPFKVVDHICKYFLQFIEDARVFPVLWHQALLVFCQRYKDDLQKEQKDLLLELVRVKHHHLISAEVKRELEGSVRDRDEMDC